MTPAAVPELPVADPVLIFAIAILVFLIAPLAFQRYRLPGIVGVILVGAAIGPNALGILERDATIVLLGEVGLIYLMFLAGLEIDVGEFADSVDRSVVFGLLSFLVPQVAGTVTGVVVLGLSIPAALLFASIFASHTLLAYPVANRLGIVGDEAMTVTIGGTIVTDTLALLVLAVVAASAQGTLDALFWVRLSIGLALFLFGVWVLVPRIGTWFFRTYADESYFEFLFVMAVLFVSAYLAELAGVETIVGAFLAGLVLNRLIPEYGTLMNRIEFVGNALFVPFFLLSVGMLVDFGAITEGTRTLLLTAVLVVSVLVTKFAAAWLTGRLYGYDREQVRGMFGLSLGQAAAALAIVLVGFELGIDGFDGEMVNAVVLMILAASLISPAVVERAGKRIALARDRDGPAPVGTRRILLPLSTDSKHREALCDLALAIRSSRSAEPIRALTVVEPGEGEADRVVRAEEALSRTEAYVAGAEVAVDTQTRLNYNVASGIVNATVENRITTTVIGWDGARSRRQRVHGDVIDQVLARSSPLVVVSRVRAPLSTARGVVLLLPPGIEDNAGFDEAIDTVGRIATATGTRVRAVAIGDPDAPARAIERLDTDLDATFEGVADWKALLAVLRDDVSPPDLVVCLSARRGTRGWHAKLETLPKSISTLVDGDFLVVYPASAERADDRQFLRLE